MQLKLTYDDFMYKMLVFFIFVVNLSTAAASCAIGLMTAMVLFHSIKYKSWPQIDKNIGYVFLIYFTLQIIIAATSLDPQISFREIAGEVHRCLLLFFAMLYIKESSQLKNILIAFLLASFINDIVGIYQTFILWERPKGLSHWPTMFASFLLMKFPIQIFIATLSMMPMWSRILSAITSALTLLCLVASQTRGAWLAFLICLIFFIFICKKYRYVALKILAAILVAFMLLAVKYPLLQDRLTSISDLNFGTNKERILMWESAANIFIDYPVHGIGQNLFNKMYNTQYISPEAKERATKDDKGHDHPHNNFMKVLCEGGLIGALSFILLYGYFFRRFYLLYLKEQSTMAFSAGLTALLILLALQLEGLTETNMNLSPVMREYWFLVGMLMVSGNIIIHGKS